MAAVIKIGAYEYLVASETQAVAVIKGLSGAVEVERHYSSKHGDCYYPRADGRAPEVGMSIVRDRQLIAREPEPGEEPEFIVTPAPKKPRGLLRQPRLLLKGGA